MKRRKSRKRSFRYSGLCLLVLLGFSFLLMAQYAVPVRADDRSYYFPRVLIEAALYPDGSMSVVEERTFCFDGHFRGAWEYIYLQNNASIKDILVSEKGEPYRQMPPGTRDIPGIFYVEQRSDQIYIDWSFEAVNEERTFTLSYTVENAASVYPDTAELYYQFIGNEWDERTAFARVELTLPGDVAGEELRIWGHGPLQGNVSRKGSNGVIWEVEDLPRRTFLEGRVVFPADLLPDAAVISERERLPAILAEEEKWAAEANRKRLQAKADLYAGGVIAIGALVFYLFLRRRAFHHPGAYEGDYYRELPGEYSPAEAGYFVRLGRVAPADITATILDLARRGHLYLEEYQGEKGLLIKRSFTDYRIYPAEGRDRLAGHERELHSFLFEQAARRIGEGVTFKEIEAFARRHKESTALFYQGWESGIKRQVRQLGLFGAAAWPGIIGGMVLFAAGLAVFIPDIFPISGIVLAVTGALLLLLSATLKNLTPAGADHRAKWKAFKRFLLHFSELDRSTIPALEIWEHYLVYAVSLGVAKQVIKQLVVVYPQIEEPHSILAGSAWFHLAVNNPTCIQQHKFYHIA